VPGLKAVTSFGPDTHPDGLLIPISIILLYIETRKSGDSFSLANACQT
jgi:hypothetical protein